MRLVSHCACSFPFALVLEERRYQPTTTRCPPRQSTRPQTCKSSSIIHVSGNLNYATSPSSKAQDRFCLKDTFLIHAFPGRLAGAIRSAEHRLSAAKGTTVPKLKQAKHCPRNTWEMLTLQLSHGYNYKSTTMIHRADEHHIWWPPASHS